MAVGKVLSGPLLNAWPKEYRESVLSIDTRDAELRLPRADGASRILEIQTSGAMTYPLVPDIAADLPDVIARSA